MNERERLSIRQAAKRLHCDPAFLRDGVRSGKLPHSRPGERKVEVYLDDAEEYRMSFTAPVEPPSDDDLKSPPMGAEHVIPRGS